MFKLCSNDEKLSQEILGPRSDQVDRLGTFRAKNLDALGKAGVLGLLGAVEFGGVGATMADMSLALGTQSQHCASTAMITLMHFCATAVIVSKGTSAEEEGVACSASGGHRSTLAFSEAGSGTFLYAGERGPE